MNAWQRCAGVWAPLFVISPGTSAQGSDPRERTICHADKAQARKGASHAGPSYAGCYALRRVFLSRDALFIVDPVDLSETDSKGQPKVAIRLAPRSVTELPGGRGSRAVGFVSIPHLSRIPLLIGLNFPPDAGDWTGRRGDPRPRWQLCWRSHDTVSDALAAFAYRLSPRHKRSVHSFHGDYESAEQRTVVWGSILISIVGLALWVHNLFLALLPRVLLKPVNAVHFYQVMLAVLAIPVWHSYSVFFDSEVYPLDAVGLTGHSARRCGAE